MPTSYAYFQKRIVPLEEARVPVMTHAFLYGTGVFEGIRGNWSDDRGEILLFRPREHFERIKMSAQIMHIGLSLSVDELSDICTQVVERCGFREDFNRGDVTAHRENHALRTIRRAVVCDQ